MDISQFTPVFIADKIEGLSVYWSGKKLLTIKYTKARIFNFTNFWNSKELENFRYTVMIKEIKI